MVSDNDATNIIASVVGLERVNELAAQLGLTQTWMQRLMMDREAVAAGRENYTSAGDLALLLELLSSGEALEPLVGERILASLGASGAPRRHRPLPSAGGVLRGQVRRRLSGRPVRARLRAGARRWPQAVLVVMTRDSGGFETVARTGPRLWARATPRPR